MRIVLTATEVVPFAKTGGLAEVVSALSRELDHAGHVVTLILPFYPRLVARCHDVIPPIESTGLTVRLPVGLQLVTAGVLRTRWPGTRAEVLLIDQPEFFGRRQPYQAWLTELVERHPAQVRVTRARNESLAHQIFAGADLILMPTSTKQPVSDF